MTMTKRSLDSIDTLEFVGVLLPRVDSSEPELLAELPLKDVPIYPKDSKWRIEASPDSHQIIFHDRMSHQITVKVKVRCGFNPCEFAIVKGDCVTAYCREFTVTVAELTMDVGIDIQNYPLPKYVSPKQWHVSLPEEFVKAHNIYTGD
jgi:hypothetical protein